ncbi:SEL1-like repeat protein [Enterovibrio sp. Hal110]
MKTLAQAAVAKFLWRGLIGQKDENGATYWAQKALPKLEKLVAVEHAEALYTLVWLTINGVGVAKDEKKAISLYERAALERGCLGANQSRCDLR